MAKEARMAELERERLAALAESLRTQSVSLAALDAQDSIPRADSAPNFDKGIHIGSLCLLATYTNRLL